MPMKVPEYHPLRRLFIGLTEKNFFEKLNWPDLHVTSYISNLLTEFTHIDNVYKIKNMRGKQLEQVAEMLSEAEVLLNAGSFEREREVHRHIGDYTLFMVSIFPEYLKRIKSTYLIHHPDFLLDYVRVGKKSYRIVSEFTYGQFNAIAPLFRKLSDNFELCILGLGYIKGDLDRLKTPEYHKLRKILLN